jgi:hypothetical protein
MVLNITADADGNVTDVILTDVRWDGKIFSPLERLFLNGTRLDIVVFVPSLVQDYPDVKEHFDGGYTVKLSGKCAGHIFNVSAFTIVSRTKPGDK